MKPIKTFSYILIFTLLSAGYAEAKSKSYGGGFRSQRTAPAPQRVAPQKQQQEAPAAQTTQSKSMFGSFGKKSETAPSAAPKNAQPLNMSKDLNGNAAQGNALKANDGRTATGAAGATGAASNTGSGWFGSGKPAAATPMQTAQPAAMQRGGGGGFMNGVMWFMLGSSLANSGHAQAAQPVQKEAQATETTTANADSNIVAPNSGIDPLTGMAAPVEEKSSFIITLLRIVVWAGIIFGLYKLVTVVMRSRNNASKEKPNYSFGDK